MGAVRIFQVGRQDVARLDAALRSLSADMGDTHRASVDDLLRAGFGPLPAFHALLAEAGPEVLAAAVYSPVMSTTWGKPGAYVSDLWVARGARGTGLGAAMLAAVRDAARTAWGAGFLRLAVYDDNTPALAFYRARGFEARPRETFMTLEGESLDNLSGLPPEE